MTDDPRGHGEGAARVLAIIVAFNDATVLERCLVALGSQVRPIDGVLVVDNSVPQPVEVDLELLKVGDRTRVLRVGENIGPAGGFAHGLSAFLKEPEWTHAWLMDDDSYPAPDALSNILKVAGRTRAGHVIYPRAINDYNGEVSSYPGWSHGPFVDRLAVELAGVPRADLFWWIEDTEYLQYRLPRSGVVAVRVGDALHHFDQPRRVSSKPPWKYYYEARNSVWYRLHVQREGFRRIWKLVRTIGRLTGSSLLNEHRGQSLVMVVRGTLDGLRARLGVTVEPPSKPS